MTRPRKATVDYFPHYCNHGKTMFVLEQRYGNDGYAAWFKTLEILGRSEGHFIDCNDPAQWEFLLAITRLNGETVDNILTLLAKLGAIDSELWSHKVIWSEHFIENLNQVYSRRNVECPTKQDILQQITHSAGLMSTETPVSGIIDNINPYASNIYPQSKVNESKVNESKDIPVTSAGLKKSKLKKSSIPENFTISREVQVWASKNGYDKLEAHLEAFIDLCKANGYTALDWDSKFKNAIRNDWGKIREKGNGSRGMPAQENTNCINHPGKPGTATKNGRWYCRMCLDRIDAPPGKFDKPLDKFEITVKDLATKLGMT